MKYLIKNLRRLLGIVALAGVAYGQGSLTTYQTIWTTQAQTGYDTAVALRQIGQSGHLVNVYFSNASGQDCTTVTGVSMQFYLEGSFNNSQWVVIQANTFIFGTVDANGLQSTQVTGFGAYSYVRMRASSLGAATIFAKCRMNGWYSGTVNGSRRPTDRLPTDQDPYAKFSFAVAAATTTTILASQGANREISVWDLQVCASAANNVTFNDSLGSNLYYLTFSASGGCLTVPYSGLYLFATDYGADLRVTTSTAANTTISLKALFNTP
jgi:hypothetical protein